MKTVNFLLFSMVFFVTTTCIYAYDKILIIPESSIDRVSVNKVYLITDKEALREIERAKKITEKKQRGTFPDLFNPESYHKMTQNRAERYFIRDNKDSELDFLKKYHKNPKYLFSMDISKKIKPKECIEKMKEEGLIDFYGAYITNKHYRMKVISDKNFSKEFEKKLMKKYPFIIKITPSYPMFSISQSDGFVAPIVIVKPKPKPVPIAPIIVPMPPPFIPSSNSLFKTLPQTYIGTFQWENSKDIQEVKFTWTDVKKSHSEEFDLIGKSIYTVNKKDYIFKITATVKNNRKNIEIMEFDDKLSTQGGKYNGTISSDLKRIQAIWRNEKTGQKGFLKVEKRF